MELQELPRRMPRNHGTLSLCTDETTGAYTGRRRNPQAGCIPRVKPPAYLAFHQRRSQECGDQVKAPRSSAFSPA